MPSPYHKPCNMTPIVAHRCAYHATNIDLGVSYMSALLQNALTPHGHAAQNTLSGLDVVQSTPYHLPTLGVYVSPLTDCEATFVPLLPVLQGDNA
jgi:hypothetical protein